MTQFYLKKIVTLLNKIFFLKVEEEGTEDMRQKKKIPRQGAVGVSAKPSSNTSLSSNACFTTNLSKRRVAVTLSSSHLSLLVTYINT